MSSSLINFTYASEKENSNKGALGSVIVGGNGLFENISSSIGEATYKVSNYTPIEFEQRIEENVDLAQKSYIPREAIERVIDFYRYICEKTGDEAQANFYINENELENIETKSGAIINIHNEPNIFVYDDIVLHFPYQINSAGQTTVEDELYDALKDQMVPWIETHSHNTMRAFRSATDEANSYNDGIQLVFGKVTSDTIDFHSWVTIRNKQFDDFSVDELNHLIDFPKLEGDSIKIYDHSAYEHVSKGTKPIYSYKNKIETNKRPSSNLAMGTKGEQKVVHINQHKPKIEPIETPIESDEHMIEHINQNKPKHSFFSKIKSFFK